MNRRPWGLIVGVVIVGMLCGCRAMSKDDAPSTPGAPPPAAGESKPAPAAAPVPTPPPQTSPTDNQAISDATVLREALGQSLLPLIEGKLLTLQKTTTIGANDPNISLEGGKLTFKQILKGGSGGEGSIQAIGVYQKLGTISGDGAIYTNPTTIDFTLNGLQVESKCLGLLSLTGNIHCSINTTYTYGTHTLSGTGQCMTHTNGILDNLKVGIGDTIQKTRYVLGFKIQGDPTDWKAYQWVGTAYVGGLAVNLTQLNDLQNACNK